MRQLEINVIQSFKRAKSDIISLQRKVIELSQAQKQLSEEIAELKQKKVPKQEKPKVKTISVKRAKKVYVAPKGGKTFHLDNCPFAKNILPKNRQTFASKTKALNAGLKACDCLKK